MKSELALGIDIGGTNVAVGLCDSLGNVHFENNFETSAFKNPDDMVSAIYDYFVDIGMLKHILGIGIGAPSGNSLTGSIESAPNLEWKDKIPLTHLFESKFKKRAFLTNDANAAALGELTYGAAKNYSDFITITLGTGLGSGIIVDGQLLHGFHGIAGEFGHVIAEKNGRLCGCGRNGCLETYASSTGVVRSYNELESDSKSSSSLSSIDSPSAQDIFQHAEEGDQFALEIVDFTARILGEALADFACFSDPQAYILFGGIAQSGTTFADQVHVHMESVILNNYKNKIKIEISSLHEENAAILGASSLVWNNLT